MQTYHLYTWTCINKIGIWHIRKLVYAYVYMHMCMHTQAGRQTDRHTYSNVCIHTRIHTQAHKHTHWNALFVYTQTARFCT